jgi:hypothetical protein
MKAAETLVVRAVITMFAVALPRFIIKVRP